MRQLRFASLNWHGDGMITEDYLMRMLLAFFKALVDARSRALNEKDLVGAAEMLEDVIGESSGLGADMFLRLSPESIATILQSTGTDPEVTEFMARSLMQAAEYREMSGGAETANLTLELSHAIADAYGHDLTVAMEEWLSEHDYS